MEVELRYFDGCPNWTVAREHLQAALARAGHADIRVGLRQIRSQAEAEELGFTGSPTIVIDGRDPFARPDAPAGLACRVYATPDGPAGTPTVDQLVTALTASHPRQS